MTRPMSEERWKYALEAAARIYGDAQDPARVPEALPNDPIRVARALLSTSSAERGLREALEKIQARVEPQFDPANSLTERDRLSLLTTLHADRVHPDDAETIEEAVDYIDALHQFLDRVVSAALSRATRSAPTHTDTKDTTR